MNSNTFNKNNEELSIDDIYSDNLNNKKNDILERDCYLINQQDCKLNDIELDNIEKQQIKELEGKEVMIYKDFYDIDYQTIHNFHKKVALYNLPFANKDEIVQYFHTFLISIKDSKNTITDQFTIQNPVVDLIPYDNKKYYILELSDKVFVNYVLKINNIEWRNHKMQIKSLQEFYSKYNQSKGKFLDSENIQKHKNIETGLLVNDENKVIVLDIPISATNSDLTLLAENYGNVKSLELIKDKSCYTNNNQKLICLIEYLNNSSVDRAIKGFTSIEYNKKKLKAKNYLEYYKSINITSDNITNTKETVNLKTEVDYISYLLKDVPAIKDIYLKQSRVVVLYNLLTIEDLFDDEDYDEIVEDIKSEIMKFGVFLNFEVPRPDSLTGLLPPGIGKVFIKYYNINDAIKAQFKLSGRSYNNRTVVTFFYPEDKYNIRSLDL